MSAPPRQGAARAWLFRVAYHEAITQRRRQKVRRDSIERVAQTKPTRVESTEHVVRTREREAAVRNAIRDLPEIQQQIVRMRIYDGLRFREIAEQLGIPLGTALARMHAALKKLKASLDPYREP